jgi:hypothetical protein
LLLPEVAFNEQRFLAKVEESLERYDQCVIAVSEGVKGPDGEFLSASGLKDSFGHSQLGGGVAPFISNLITKKLGCKFHGRSPITSCARRATLPPTPISSTPMQSVVRRWNSQLLDGLR